MATPKAPSFLYASMRVFDLSVGEMLWSRRTIFMALVVGVPVLLALIVRGATMLGAPGLHVNNTAVNGPAIFGLMIWAFYLRFSVPVLGAFYGTSLIADEVEDKTRRSRICLRDPCRAGPCSSASSSRMSSAP